MLRSLVGSEMCIRDRYCGCVSLGALMVAYSLTEIVLRPIHDRLISAGRRGIPGLTDEQSPFHLGVGFSVATFLDAPRRYLFYAALSEEGDSTEAIKARHAMAMCFQAFFIMYLVTKLNSWFKREKDKGAISTKNFFSSLMININGISKFVCAWMWADLFKYNWFYVLFTQLPTSLAEPVPFSTTATFWAVFYYAALITVVTTLYAPVLTQQERLTKVDQFYCHKVLCDDSKAALSAGVGASLLITIGAITVGWAWVDVCTVECDANITLTCPSQLEVGPVLEYIAFAMMYVFLCSVAFHVANESWRLQERLLLVASLSEGSMERFIWYMDTNHDGVINRQEMLAYCHKNGMDASLALQAFDNIAFGMDLRGNATFDRATAKMHSRCMRRNDCRQVSDASSLTRICSYKDEQDNDCVDLYDFTEHFGEIISEARREFRDEQLEKAKEKRLASRGALSPVTTPKPGTPKRARGESLDRCNFAIPDNVRDHIAACHTPRNTDMCLVRTDRVTHDHRDGIRMEDLSMGDVGPSKDGTDPDVTVTVV
eukprot:TRINITY_DN12682_c0_g2_i3.p1 TRINITY_DN12682_c0_g2~~TRINITY_DN12682_c0_g2_i3.p1  ORF type:complete len:543 (+),score=77.16 TRINITY_DN12682_c0_g2_i3:105-1733(+)